MYDFKLVYGGSTVLSISDDQYYELVNKNSTIFSTSDNTFTVCSEPNEKCWSQKCEKQLMNNLIPVVEALKKGYAKGNACRINVNENLGKYFVILNANRNQSVHINSSILFLYFCKIIQI